MRNKAMGKEFYMGSRKGLSRELSREWNMHMKLNTGVSHLKNRRKLNNRGMGTVEMILIIVVLIGLVLIFKTQIMDLVGNVFDKIAVDSSAILS